MSGRLLWELLIACFPATSSNLGTFLYFSFGCASGFATFKTVSGIARTIQSTSLYVESFEALHWLRSGEADTAGEEKKQATIELSQECSSDTLVAEEADDDRQKQESDHSDLEVAAANSAAPTAPAALSTPAVPESGAPERLVHPAVLPVGASEEAPLLPPTSPSTTQGDSESVEAVRASTSSFSDRPRLLDMGGPSSSSSEVAVNKRHQQDDTNNDSEGSSAATMASLEERLAMSAERARQRKLSNEQKIKIWLREIRIRADRSGARLL